MKRKVLPLLILMLLIFAPAKISLLPLKKPIYGWLMLKTARRLPS